MSNLMHTILHHEFLNLSIMSKHHPFLLQSITEAHNGPRFHSRRSGYYSVPPPYLRYRCSSKRCHQSRRCSHNQSRRLLHLYKPGRILKMIGLSSSDDVQLFAIGQSVAVFVQTTNGFGIPLKASTPSQLETDLKVAASSLSFIDFLLLTLYSQSISRLSFTSPHSVSQNWRCSL